MLSVAGNNLFGQWMCNENICEKFSAINEETINNSTQICICWSYNFYQMNKDLYISGAFGGEDKQLVKLNLIEELLNTNKFLIAGNDYYLIIINVQTNNVFTYDLQTKQYKRIKFVENVNEAASTIVKVVLNNNMCLYLTSKGDVYCGILPVLLDINELHGKVIDVALGYEHCILLTEAGTVYTWGNGRRLQLGHGELSNLDLPTEVNALAGIKITKISAGGWHSCAISEFGDLYVWGWNDTGQLGVRGNPEEHTMSELQSYGLPILVDLLDENSKEIDLNVVDVSCGSRHTAILLEDGSIWTSGNNKYGQLGLSTEDFKQIDSFKNTQTFASFLKCGPWSTVIK